MNIQINNIHSTNSLSVIKLLSRIKKYNIVVIGSDIYKKGECAGSLLVDKYYQSPPITKEAEYINFLNDVNKKEKIDLLIPASDAVLLSKYSSQIKTRFFLADYETVSLFKDKLRATQTMLSKNINVPRICDCVIR
jgi:Icc-related predicted phosphoesterase